MKTTSRLKAFFFSLTLLCSGNALAIDIDDLVEARHGLMNLYAVNIDLLGEMIRGNLPYDQKKAQALADNLLALSRMDASPLWKRGTSMADPGMRGKTSAKRELWTNRQEVSELYAELQAAVEVLAKNAGWSVDALQENIAGVNAACKGCHRKFRSKK